MEQMVSNFNYLREQKRLVDIPVRHGHPGWLINGTPGTGAVVGWHTSLTTEEKDSPFGDGKYTYLLADYEILDSNAAAAIESGLWRNRSSEIIGYSTNEEAEFWPVYGGFAFVDIPAVEGLNFSRAPGAADAAANTRFIVMLNKEIPVTQPAAGAPAATQAGAPQLPFVQNLFTAPAQQQPSVPTQAAQSAPQTQAQPFVFSVNGQATTDFAAVQQHISALEAFQSETKESARTAFIDSLLARNVFMASEKDNLVKLAKGMGDEQWQLWTAAYSNAGQNTTLAQHASPGQMAGQQQNQSGGVQPPQNDEIEIAKQTVAMHRMANMSEADLKKTGSYRKLVAAGIEQA